MKTLKTALLLGILTVILVVIGGLLGGPSGARTAFIFALVINFISYWFCDKIVLAMYRAKPIGSAELPELQSMVRELAMRAQIPMPRLYLTLHRSPNAFATGRNPAHAVVCVTQGILELLNPDELKGVLAHELGHVKNRDILVSTIAATIAGAITMLADWARWAMIFGGGRDRDRRSGGGEAVAMIALMILAPLAAMLVQLAISRSREYGADETGAHLAHSPMGLASALAKLEDAVKVRPLGANPSTAHLFIVNPLRADFIATLFSTHPPMQERIKRLREMRIS
ncbi:MAG: zinc metalloprotease HtpX [Candidatus Omnitrophica bacterium]|nr:zinc metalloprotease HtpX [Candidatus Omnitrophota bacterium]